MTNRHFQRSTDSHSGHATALPIRPTVRDAVRRALFAMAPTAIAVFGAGTAVANPEGGVVVRGNATINGGAGILNVNQASQRAVINWRGFSIGQNETVNFNQPSATASTLNRVTGAQRSVIEGALNANGRIYLINPSGVLFTGSSQVNVGSLIATTGNITDDNFMADRMEFRGTGNPAAAIENFGTISVRDGGLAALVAPSVRNAGLIQANLGRIALGGGESFTLDFYGDRLINFSVGEGVAAGNPPQVDNSGALHADGGQVLLSTQTASDVVGGVVNMSGIIQARSVSRDATGTIVLDAADGSTTVTGQIDSSGTTAGTTGGRVEVLGRSVTLQSGATIDASGSAGGGTVHIGGPPAGEVSSNRAANVVVEQGATIDASAREAGNGGTVSVWGTDAARFEGGIAANGGNSSGDGGFVEVSSRGILQFLGDVVASARNGAPGTVLLDPDQITIEIERTGSSDPTASVIDGDALTRMLRSGTHVNLTATESITVNHLLDGRPLDGGTTPSGNVRLTASAIVIKAPVITNNAPINLNGGSGGVTIQGAGFLYVANGTGAVGTAPITVVAADGKIDAIKGGSGNGQLISLGTISLEATADVNLGADLTGLGGAQGASGIGGLVVTSTDGHIAIAGVDSNGQVALTAASGVSLTGKSVKAVGSVSINGGSGPIQIARIGDNAAAAAIDSTGGNIELRTSGAVAIDGSLRTENGSISIGSPGAQIASLVAGDGAVVKAGGTGRNVSLSSVGGVQLNGVSAGGAVDVTGSTISNRGTSIVSDGSVTLTATGTGAKTIDLQGLDTADSTAAGIESRGVGTVSLQTHGGVNLQRGIKTASGDIVIGANGDRIASLTTGSNSVLQAGGISDVSVYAIGSVALHGVTAGGDVEIEGASIVDSGHSIAVGGNVTLIGGSGGITLDCIGSPTSCAAAIESKGWATLSTTGDVVVNSGITAAGNVAIGTSTVRAASLLANGSIQAGTNADSSSNIEVHTSGNVSTQDLIVGRSGRIAIDADDPDNLADRVTLNRELGGFVDTVPSLPGAGIGSLHIAADGAVTVHGATANGMANLTDIDISGSSISNTGKSLIARGAGNASHESVHLAASSSTADAIKLDVGPGTAGIDIRGSGSAVLLTRGGVDLSSGIQTNGGDIVIGNSTVRAASVTLRPGVALQSGGGSAPTSGAISIYSRGAIDAQSSNNEAARSLVGSDIVINTDDGDAATRLGRVSLDGLFGFDPAVGLGSLTIVADGDVDLRGAKTSHDLSVTSTGSIHQDDSVTGGRSLIAGGDLILTSIAGGMISLGTIVDDRGTTDVQDDVLAAAASAGANVRLHTVGDVNLGTGLSAVRGGIEIGIPDGPDAGPQPDQRVASIEAYRGSILSTGIPTDLDGNGTVDELVGGGSIFLASTGDLNIDRVQTGLQSSISMSSLESVDIRGQIRTNTLNVSGRNVSLSRVTAYGEGLSPPVDSVLVTVPSRGQINVYGPITAYHGSVRLGLSLPIESDPDLYGPTGENARINLSNDITVRSQFARITLYGDVTLFDGVTATTIDFARGQAETLDRFDPFFDATSAEFTAEISRDIELPAIQWGHVPGPPSDALSDVGFCGGTTCAFDVSDSDGTNRILRILGESERNWNYLGFVGSYLNNQTGGWGIKAVDSDGRPLTTAGINNQSDDAGICVGAWICGYRYADDQTTASANYNDRFSRLVQMLGTLSATLTVDDNGSIRIAGNVGRYVAPLSPGRPQSGRPLSGDGMLVLYPSHVNQELRVDMGRSGSLTVMGSVGDSELDMLRTGNTSPTYYLTDRLVGLGQVCGDTGPCTGLEPAVNLRYGALPELGTFTVTLLGNQFAPSTISIGRAGGYLNALNAQPAEWVDLDQSGVNLVPRVYSLPVPWTQEGRGSNGTGFTITTSAPGPLAFGNLPGVGGSTSTARTTNGATGSTALQGSTGSGVAGSVSGGNSGAGFGDVADPSAGDVSSTTTPSVAENDQRQNGSESDDSSGTASNDDEDLCRRGAGQLADVGTYPGVTGAEANVFARCRSDFQ